MSRFQHIFRHNRQVANVRITVRVLIIAVLLLCVASSAARAKRAGPIVRLDIDGIIGGASKNYVERGIRHAESINANCVIITIDTPGGLMDSMKDIATAMINAHLPVVVYVFPNGSTATSAGFFILMASDIAAMAPDTSAGSAHPVSGDGQKMDDVMKEKTTNYAVKYMEQLVRRRGRNVEIGRNAVVKSISVTAQEARAKNVVEIIASDFDDLLAQLDGMEVVKGGQETYVVYLDEMSDSLRAELDKRGLLPDENEKTSGKIVVEASDIDDELRGALVKRGIIEKNEQPAQLLLSGKDLDGKLRKMLKKRGIRGEDYYGGQLELSVDEIDDELKRLLTGREEISGGTTYVFETKDARVEDVAMSLREKFFSIIGHPNIAYILLMIGVYALIFEVTHPGTVVPGVIGAVCLVLAFTSFQVIPINTIGLLLIVGAVVMFMLEIKIVSHGLLTIGGIALMILGSLMLIDSTDPAMQIDLKLIATVVFSTMFLFLVVLAAVIKSHRAQVTTGKQGMVGKKGKVRRKLDPEGKVFANGELWNAVSQSGETIEAGARVEIVSVDGMEIIVRLMT